MNVTKSPLTALAVGNRDASGLSEMEMGFVENGLILNGSYSDV